MPQDIFDEVAEARDIFDEVAEATAAPEGGFQGVPYAPGREPEGTGPFGVQNPTVNPLTGQRVYSTGGPSLNPLNPILEGVLPRYESMAPFPGQKPPPAVEAIGGAYNALAGAAESMTSPAAIATLGAAGAVPALARPAAAAWTAVMAKDLPKQVEHVAQVFAEDRPLSEKVEAATALALTAEFMRSGAKGALTPTQTPGRTAGEMLKEQVEKTEFAKPGDVIQQPLVENLRQAQAPLTAAAVEQTAKAPETPAPPSEPVPAPKTTPAATVEATEAIPEPVKVGEEPAPAPEAKPAEVAKEGQAEPQKPTGPKWTTATDEPPLGSALYGPFGIPDPIATYRAARDLIRTEVNPRIKATVDAIMEVGKEALNAPKMNDYRRSVLNWSAKLQRSFGESASAQKEINEKVPDPVRQAGITNWLEAGGDAAVLAQRAAATTDLKLKAGYDAALNLTPEELAVANDVKVAFDSLGARGKTYGVLNTFRENYAPHIWDLGKGPTGGATSRTLKDKFKFSRARTFDSFYEGEQAGFVPKTKEIGKLLPVYMHEMNTVIAARQLVEQMSKGEWEGEPLVSPRGVGVQVQGPQGQATLVMPKVPKAGTQDYKTLENQPALTDWVWRTTDSAGNPVFEKADLALHPEAYKRLKNVLGKSAIREWYNTRTSAVAQIPKTIVKAIDVGQSETKRTMLGFFATFHQIQEGFHGIGHRVSPVHNIPKIDLVNDARQMDAARHGLMLLPDRTSESQFMEGFKTSGLVSRIPKLGPLADWYSNYLFKEYIPGLKFKTYEAILERNNRVYADKLASGEFKPEDIKVLSAEQANAAYGHLNYADLARNPTIQHIMQVGLLAPDFLEARGRFAAQALKGAVGTKVGREQVIALATLAVAQATLAWIAAKTTGGEWDAKHPFEMRHGSRKYTMRSVPEDIFALQEDAGRFLNSRLSPIVGKGGLQYITGRDYAGRKVTAGQTTRELLTSPIPLSVRSIPQVQQLTGMDRPGQVKPWEQFAGTMGLRISRNYANDELYKLHNEWMEKNPDKKIRADYERHQTEVLPVSKYKGILSAIADRDEAALRKAVADLKEKEGVEIKDIKKRLAPKGTLFHEKAATENKFRAALTPDQRALYQQALRERQEQYRWFRRFF